MLGAQTVSSRITRRVPLVRSLTPVLRQEEPPSVLPPGAWL